MVARLALALGVLCATFGGVLATGWIGPAPAAPSGPPKSRPEVPVTPTDLRVGLANNSPAVVADPTDERFVVIANRLDAPDFGCGLQLSGDGGRHWVPSRPVPDLPAGAEKCYAPEVAFDRHGKLYYLFVGLRGRGNEPMGAFLTTSADRGATFTAPRGVLGPLNFGIRMAIDRTVGRHGRIHLTWIHATSDPTTGGFGPPPNPIVAAHSDDGGRTFSEPVQVSDRHRQRVVAPALALGRDGAVHVAYYDLGKDAIDYQGLEGPVWDGAWSLVVATSGDGGRRFDAGAVVNDDIAPSERVMLIFTMPPPALVAGKRGQLCLAWTDARHGDADALVSCSDHDSGRRAWQKPRRLNDDKAANGRTQYLPQLSVGPNGRLDAIYYDRREDPRNLHNDVRYTFSSDGARTFARSVRLTQDPSFSRIGQRYVGPAAELQTEFGSRLGLLSRKAAVLAAWPDTRNSRPGTTEQDLFATQVDLRVKHDHSRQARRAGVGLLAFALLPVAFSVRRL